MTVATKLSRADDTRSSETEPAEPVSAVASDGALAARPKPEPEPAPKPKRKPKPKDAAEAPKPDPVATAVEPAPAAPPDAPVAPAPAAMPTPTATPSEPRPDENNKSKTDVVRELRKNRGQRLALRLLLWVVLPTLGATVYYGFVASPQFESTSLFAIHSSERQQSLSLMASLLGSVSSLATHDTLAARDYALSRDMLKRLDAKHRLIAHYKDPSRDWWSRLSADASFEDAYGYYKDKVSADYDTSTGTLKLNVRAFSAEKAHALVQGVLELAERQLNDLSERERDDQTRYANQELATAESRLAAARKALLKLQQEHGEISPLHTAEAAMGIRTAIQGEVAKARAELMQARAFMTPSAPQVVALNQRVKSLEAQAAQESARLVNPRSKGGVAENMGNFEAAAIEKEFAEKAYESARAALELARSDALRQHRYLVRISEPSVPDEATYPRRILGVLTVFLLSFLVWGVGSLMVAAVREHAQV